MGSRVGSKELAALARCLRRWTALVALFARRTPGRLRMSERHYHLLHQELIAACRALAAIPEAPRRELGPMLEKLAQPWLTCSALERADRDILLDLLARCRQAERDMGVGRPALAVLPWALGTLLLAGAAALVGLAAQASGTLRSPLGPQLRDLAQLRAWTQPAWILVRWLVTVPSMLAVGAAVIVIAIVLVARAARR
jgi:hypothetical protein